MICITFLSNYFSTAVVVNNRQRGRDIKMKKKKHLSSQYKLLSYSSMPIRYYKVQYQLFPTSEIVGILPSLSTRNSRSTP